MDTLKLHRGRRGVVLGALLLVIVITPGASLKEPAGESARRVLTVEEVVIGGGILDSLLLIGPAIVTLPIYQTMHVLSALRFDKTAEPSDSVSEFSQLGKLYRLYSDILRGNGRFLSQDKEAGETPKKVLPLCTTLEAYRFDAHACTMENNWAGTSEEETLMDRLNDAQ